MLDWTGMRIFDYGSQAAPKPSTSAAKAIAKVLFSVMGVNGTQPVPDISSARPGSETPAQNQTTTDATKAWRVFNDRRSMVRDIDAMDARDPIVSKALDIVADHAATYETDATTPLGKNKKSLYVQGLRVVSDNPEVEKIISSLITRLDLNEEMWQIARRAVKYGTYLPEIVVDDQGNIVALLETAAHSVWPAEDGRGHKIPGWVYKEDKDTAGFGAVDPGKYMEEWQILPFLFGPKNGFFTQPMLGPVRYDWKRLMRLEDNLAVQRLRVGDRYVHHVPMNQHQSEEEIRDGIRAYKSAISKRGTLGEPSGDVSLHDSPLDGTTEVFLPKFGDNSGQVEVLNSGTAHLSNLTDMQYLRERIIVRLGVPIPYLQIMSMQKTHLAAGAGLSGMDKQFSKTLRHVQDCVRRGFTRLFDIQLAFKGILIEPGLYTIELPKIVTKDALNDAKVALTNAQAAVYFSEAFGALPLDVLAEAFMTLTTDQQDTMKGFISQFGDRVVKAKIKALEVAAQPKPALGGKDRIAGGNPGSGNANKSLAARSTEQKGAKQSIGFEATVAAIVGLRDQLLQQGIESDKLDALTEENVREDLAAIVDWTDENGELA